MPVVAGTVQYRPVVIDPRGVEVRLEISTWNETTQLKRAT
jgi:hypothetical protein